MICIKKLTRLMPKFCISEETTLFLPRLYLPKQQHYKQHSIRQISVSLPKSHNNSLCFPISLSDNRTVTEAAAVKLICTSAKPNFSLPWQRKRQKKCSNSGFVIEGRKILTNAHCVEAYTHLKLRKRDSTTLYTAKVLAIGIECDIALLTVDNDEFWDGVVPVQFGELPALKDAVTVVGYPTGGETISVRPGVVSRIEITSYSHSSAKFLGLQVDTAIISGNSGGPVFNEKGSCIGIAFRTSRKEGADTGEVIPTPVIRHFIQDYEQNGAYTGFPKLRLGWEKMENPDHRTSMGMKAHQNGVRIKWIDSNTSEGEVLKVSDIILGFDGVDIANDGTVPFRYGDHIDFSWLVSQKYVGDVAPIKVLRNSEILEFDVKLDSLKKVIPDHNNGNPPSYYIIAGIVFTTVSVPYLRSRYGKKYIDDAPVKLTGKLGSRIKSENEQIVVVSQVLEADINIGYEEICDSQVLAFNGKPVTNLKSLANSIEICSDEFLKFDLEDKKNVVLQTKAAKKATQNILTTYCILSTMSDDLKPKFFCGCSSHSRCCDELNRFNDFYTEFISRSTSSR